MSVIPKINVSLPKKRQRSNLSCDCSTTSNFGSVQPTLCRELVPDETLSVKTSSLVRLASMPVPTFGRMHLRHYHAFVPYETLYEPFNAFLSAQNFRSSNPVIQSFIPDALWRFDLHALWQTIILNNSFVSIYDNSADDYIQVTKVSSNPNPRPESFQVLEQFYQLFIEHPDDYLFSLGTYETADQRPYRMLGLPSDGASLCLGDSFINESIVNADGTSVGDLWYKLKTRDDKFERPQLVTFESADFVLEQGRFCLLFKLTPKARHLRKIVIGLGYQFTPFNANICFENPFKLLAFYKTWFEYFSPVRERAFQDTACYNYIKLSAETPAFDCHLFYTTDDTSVIDAFSQFIVELMRDTFYFLPSDYFSMAIQQPSMGNSAAMTSISTPVLDDGSPYSNYNAFQSSEDATGVQVSYPEFPILQKLGLALLNFTNKNTVIGRNVREYLKVHFGIVDEDGIVDSSGVDKIGVADVNIEVNSVMSTAPSENGYLGEYAGRGLGYKESESFDYHAKKFGVWITLSVIIPQSGYYQGTLRENTSHKRFDYFTNEFDALGYDVLERRELMDSYNAKGIHFNPDLAYNPLSAFGFVPRYSHYKVGRNIVNGDLSLAGFPSMTPYTFDRKFETMRLEENFNAIQGTYKSVEAPPFVPVIIFDGFRKVGESDDFGQYNRIFNVTSSLVDHFIIHTVFDIEAIAPWKSLSDSFDTFVEGEDVTSVSHS